MVSALRSLYRAGDVRCNFAPSLALVAPKLAGIAHLAAIGHQRRAVVDCERVGIMPCHVTEQPGKPASAARSAAY